MASISNLLARELANNILFFLFLFLAGLLGIFLWSQIRKFPDWYHKDRNKTAIGLLMLCVGIAINRGYGVVATWQLYHGRSLESLFNLKYEFAITFTGTIMTMIGAACCARMFTKDEWGHWPWVIGIPLTAVLAYGVHLVVRGG